MLGEESRNTNSGSVSGYVPPQQGSEGAVAGGQDYYYYYEMPDGSIGYMTANEYNQMYSPNEQQPPEPEEELVQQGNDEAGPHPAGYVEPTYGRGTAYGRTQEQYVTSSQMSNTADFNSCMLDRSANNVYYHCNSTAVYGSADAAAGHQFQQPTFAPPVVYGEPPGGVQTTALVPPLGAADGMTPAPLPELPHELAGGGWYVPPPSFEALRRWNGAERWTTPLCRACCHDPCFFLGACVAPWCVVAAHRRRLLHKDHLRYRCCAGVCGRLGSCECRRGVHDCCCGGANCICCGGCCCGGEEVCRGDSECSGSCPHCGLIAEVMFCLPCACQANQYMLMQRYNLKKSCWDSTVLWFGCFCAPFHWCGDCTCWFPESMWDWLYVLTYPCMLTQHHRELAKREETNV